MSLSQSLSPLQCAVIGKSGTVTRVLDQTLSSGRQLVTAMRLLRASVAGQPSRKVRLTVKSDASDFQSSAISEIWDGQRWNVVHAIPYGQMKTPHQLIYRTSHPATWADYAADLAHLTKITLAIID